MYTCSFLFLLLCTMFTVWALPPIDIMLDYSCSNDHRKHIAYPIIFARWTLNTGHTVYNSMCFVCVHIIFVSFFVASFVENTFLCCSNRHWMWNLTSTLIIYRISDWWERERKNYWIYWIVYFTKISSVVCRVSHHRHRHHHPPSHHAFIQL